MNEKILIGFVLTGLICGSAVTPAFANGLIYIFYEDFTATDGSPADVTRWTYLKDDPASSISIESNRLYCYGGTGTNETIIESKQTFPNLFEVYVNYSRVIDLAVNGSFASAELRIQFNATYYISVAERGNVSGGKLTANVLEVSIVNKSQTVLIPNILFYWYPNCLNNTVLQLWFAQLAPNQFQFMMFYVNATHYLLTALSHLTGNLSAFATTVRFVTIPVPVPVAGGNTSYDALRVVYMGEYSPQSGNGGDWVSMFIPALIGAGVGAR